MPVTFGGWCFLFKTVGVRRKFTKTQQLSYATINGPDFYNGLGKIAPGPQLENIPKWGKIF